MALFRIFTSIHQVDATDWQQRIGSAYPFISQRFLAALEDSGCIGQDSGWDPLYILVDDSEPFALLTFIKQHSYGEYVFDWSWADAYHQHGIGYYPKLLCGAPFTPATGPRILTPATPSQQQLTLATQVLTELCQQYQLSGWHLNFFEPQLQPLFADTSAHIRLGCQFHWHNRHYQSFAHFLQSFRSSKRKNVLKERHRVQQHIQLSRLTGSDISADDISEFYRCYQLTYLKRHSSGYLNEAFFQQLRISLSDQMMLVKAQRGQQPVAYALYFFDQHTLYGRYWGCLQEVDGLHFEACYYQGIEFCIEQALQRFDPGTQGEHKISRGFEPTLTYSAHWLRHPQFHQAVEAFALEEAQQVQQYLQQARLRLPFKSD